MRIAYWISRDPLGDEAFTLLFDQRAADGNYLQQQLLEPIGDTRKEYESTLFGFVKNAPLSSIDILGLQPYKERTVTDDDVTKKGKIFKTTIIGGIAFHHKYVAQRKCIFRCYHKDTYNCYKIPCKTRACIDERDHGVEISLTVNAKGDASAAICTELMEEVRIKTITGGSTRRNTGTQLN